MYHQVLNVAATKTGHSMQVVCRMKQIFVRILVVLTITVLGTNSKSGDCECGVRGDGRQRCRRSGRVAGGDEAAVGQFPWMALLVIRKTGEKTRRCGGSQ